MLVWFAATSIVVTFLVFQSPALDYRLVALGSVVPLVELPWQAGPLHSLAAATVVLGIVMLSTVRRRLVRRRWLGLPIGMYLHVLLDLAWARTRLFWWPAFGWRLPSDPVPELARGWGSLVLELLGAAAAWWAFRRFGLADPARRRTFLRTGQLDRDVVGSR